MKKPGIYLIKSKSNESKKYVGSSYNIYKRILTHKRKLITNKHKNQRLQNHVNKYGIDDLIFEKLEFCTKEKLIEREQYWYNKIKPFFCIRKVVDSNAGLKQTSELILKRSKAIKKFYTDKQTEEHKKQFSDKMKAISAERNPIPNEYKLYYLNKTDKQINRHYIVECTCMLCGESHERTYSSLKRLNNQNNCCIRVEKRYKPKEYKEPKGHNYSVKMGRKSKNKYIGVTWDSIANIYRARIKHKGKLIDVCRSKCQMKCLIDRNEYIITHKLPHKLQKP